MKLPGCEKRLTKTAESGHQNCLFERTMTAVHPILFSKLSKICNLQKQSLWWKYFTFYSKEKAEIVRQMFVDLRNSTVELGTDEWSWFRPDEILFPWDKTFGHLSSVNESNLNQFLIHMEILSLSAWYPSETWQYPGWTHRIGPLGENYCVVSQLSV